MWRSLVTAPRDTLRGRLLRLPLRLLPRGMVVSVRSGINHGLHWIIGSSTHGCWLGTYETHKQDAVRRLARPGMTIFDVGANAGFYTMAFSRLVGAKGRVYAFEPFAENVANLLKHVAINRKTVWLVALHGDEQKRRCQSLLIEAGYRLYGLDGTEFDSGPLPTDEIYAVPA